MKIPFQPDSDKITAEIEELLTLSQKRKWDGLGALLHARQELVDGNPKMAIYYVSVAKGQLRPR